MLLYRIFEQPFSYPPHICFDKCRLNSSGVMSASDLIGFSETPVGETLLSRRFFLSSFTFGCVGFKLAL
jgi:hypothetical protein